MGHFRPKHPILEIFAFMGGVSKVNGLFRREIKNINELNADDIRGGQVLKYGNIWRLVPWWCHEIFPKVF